MKEYIALALVAGAVFGICVLVDWLFKKIFRSQSQHHSGTAVRLNKRYGTVGLILAVFGISVVLVGIPDNWLFLVAGAVFVAVGMGLVIYYLSFGVFYDEDSFILATIGKKSKTYRYEDICGQQLYMTTGGAMVEIYLCDGRTFQIQSVMTGGYEFLDYAFQRWLEQTGKEQKDCDFYDPEQCCWFPKVGV